MSTFYSEWERRRPCCRALSNRLQARLDYGVCFIFSLTDLRDVSEDGMTVDVDSGILHLRKQHEVVVGVVSEALSHPFHTYARL